MPPVIAFLPLIAGVIGAGGAILGGIQEQKTAEANAQIARNQAREAQIRTSENVRRQRLALGRLRGKQRAGFAASGVLTAAGTPLLIDVTTATEGERDIALTKRAGTIEAGILTTQASIFQQGLLKQRSRVAVRVLETLGIIINDKQIPFRSVEDLMGFPPTLLSEDLEVVNLGWDRDAFVTVTQELAQPTQLLAILGQLSVADP